MATGPNPRIAQVNDWVGRSAPFIVRPDGERADAGAPRRLPSGAAGATRWAEGRLAAVEALWGEGFTSPGGSQQVLSLASNLALNQGEKLLLLGGGLGGPACAIAENSGAFIVSFEADSTLAAAARARLAVRANASRVSIACWDRAAPSFGSEILDHALSLEALRGPDPGPTLDVMAASLRRHGQIVMTEMVSDRDIPDTDREYAAWCRLEHRLPGLPCGEAITAALTRLDYDVRVVEDISTPHVQAALAGWRHAMQAISRGAIPAAGSAAMVMMEAELWLLRIRMMRRFGLRLVRWHAVGMA